MKQLVSLLLAATLVRPVLSTGNTVPDFATGHFSVSLWFKTTGNGPLFAKTAAEGSWVPEGKALFISNGRLNYDIGWVGCNRGKTNVSDDKWHHVTLTSGVKRQIFLDGKLEINVGLESARDPRDSVFKVGTCSDNFPLNGDGFAGQIDDVRIYSRTLSDAEIGLLASGRHDEKGLAAHWPLDGSPDDTVGKNTLHLPGKPAFTAGRFNKALALTFKNTPESRERIKPGSLDLMANLQGGKPFGFDKLLFVKRYTYTSNHYYTEFINGEWHPGGNICVLDLGSGSVTELVPELKGGVFERFDLDFDARRVVFAWKAEAQTGYRLYEIEIDPQTGERKGELKQLTFPSDKESELVRLYRVFPHYHHGTDDMQPCYLPNGDICFISTRCQYGILCDGPDDFTTTVLYRLSRGQCKGFVCKFVKAGHAGIPSVLR